MTLTFRLTSVVITAYALFILANVSYADTTTNHPEDTKWCFHCHGHTGTSANSRIPNLAGQKTEYLENQLADFQQGNSFGDTHKDRAEKEIYRVHRSAAYNSNRLSLEDITAVSMYYSSQTCQSDAPTDKNLQPPPTVEQCVRCHGPAGISTEVNTPNLAGQKRAYLEKQLTSFGKTAHGHDITDLKDRRHHPVMSELAGVLSEKDMNAIAAYYNSLPCD